METEKIVKLRFGDVELHIPRNAEGIRIARKLLDLLEDELCKAQGCTETHSPISSQAKQVESPPERKDEVLVPIPQGQPGINFELIPKFEWDKKAEKNCDTLFFYETYDGRVMLSYSKCRVFTTKAAVMQIPYPIPTGYAPLAGLVTSKRTAVRVYRKYLAEQEEKGTEQVGKGTEREEKLKKVAEINAERWKAEKGSSEKKQGSFESLHAIAEKTKVIKRGVGAEETS